MIQHMTFLYRFQLGVAQAMVADLSPQQMVGQPHGVVNHPAWSLGHLVMTADRLGQLLGLDAAAPADWTTRFATGRIPSGELSDYPPKEELLDELTRQHARNTAAAAETDPAWFAKPNPNERRRKRFPTVGDIAVYLMTSHETLHLGQIAAWRRAMGLAPARR